MAKKNTLLTTGLIILFWLWFPTLEPTDFISLSIISYLGPRLYTILSIIVLILFYIMIDGKTLTDKIKNVAKEIKGWFK
jgi:hypothetical protein